MPRLNRKPRRRVDPDVLPEDITSDLYDLSKFTASQLERWLSDYPDGCGLTSLFIGRELRQRSRTT